MAWSEGGKIIPLFGYLCIFILVLMISALLLTGSSLLKRHNRLRRRLENIHKMAEQAIDDGTMPAEKGALAFIVCESDLSLVKRRK